MIKVEKPAANDTASRLKRKNSVDNSPKKIAIFKISKLTPVLTRPFPASGLNIQAMPYANRRKLTPMKTPPAISDVGSKNLLWPSVANSAASKITCHSSILRIIFLAVASSTLFRKKPYPFHQSHEGADERERCQRDQQPWRRAKVNVKKISQYQPTKH